MHTYLKGISTVIILLLGSLPQQLVAQWRVDRVMDPITDRDESTAFVQSAGGGSRLAVRCTTKPGIGVEVFLAFDEFMGNERSDVRLRYRVDERPATPWLRATPSTEGTGLFLNPAEAWTLLVELKLGTKVVFEAEDYRDTPHLARFGLSGSAAAINALSDCLTPGTYAVYFPELPETVNRATLDPHLLEFSCDLTPVIRGGRIAGRLRLTDETKNWTVTHRRPLIGPEAAEIVDKLRRGGALTTLWSSDGGQTVQPVRLNEGGRLRRQIDATMRDCSTDYLNPKIDITVPTE